MSRSWTDLKPSHVSGLYSPLLTDTRQYQLYWPFHAQSCMLFTAPLELTTGLKQIAGAPLPWKSRYLASMLLTSFGGFCVMAQTKSVLENSLSLIPYAISKCLNASAIFLILVFSDIV